MVLLLFVSILFFLIDNIVMLRVAHEIKKIKEMSKFNLICSLLAIIVLYFKFGDENFELFVGVLISFVMNMTTSFNFFSAVREDVFSYKSFLDDFDSRKKDMSTEEQNNCLTSFFKNKRKLILVSENTKKIIRLNTVIQALVFCIACLIKI